MSLDERVRSQWRSSVLHRYATSSLLADWGRISPSVAAQELYCNPDTGAPYRFTGYEFNRSILDDMHGRVVCQKCNQVGITVVATHRAAYALDVLGLDCFYMMPTTAMAR